MAGSPPALPGFGNSGKSFLIDNLLQSQTTPACPDGATGGHMRLGPCEHPRRTWGSEHGPYQCQAHSPQQVKDIGGPLLPHSGGNLVVGLFCFVFLLLLLFCFCVLLAAQNIFILDICQVLSSLPIFLAKYQVSSRVTRRM